MTHVLIIEDNFVVSKILERQLAAQGYNSFDRTWDMREAMDAAQQRKPGLIVVGDSMLDRQGLAKLREIAEDSEAPVLVVTGDSARLRDRMPEDASITGPYLVGAMQDAIAAVMGQKEAPAFA